MYKTVRFVALALLFVLSTGSAVKAERWGTNPRPGVVDGDNSTSNVVTDAILFNLGIY